MVAPEQLVLVILETELLLADVLLILGHADMVVMVILAVLAVLALLELVVH